MKTTIRTKNEFRSLDKHIINGKEYNVSIMATKTEPGMTLEKLATTVEQLATKVNHLATRVDQLATTVEQLAIRLDQLTQIVIEGFARQEEWNRRIEKRLEAIENCPTIKKELKK